MSRSPYYSTNSLDYGNKRRPSRSPNYRSESPEDVERKRRNRWAKKFEDRRSCKSQREKKSRQLRTIRFCKEDSSNCAVTGTSGPKINGYKSQLPNNIIFIKHLPLHITENDIRVDTVHSGLLAKDIRVVRQKDTGASRGFAFVEFTTVQEAQRWMEMKQGVLILQNGHQSIMNYSNHQQLRKEQEKAPSQKPVLEWFCVKCGGPNFPSRDKCCRCNSSRVEEGHEYDEISNYPTNAVMLHDLNRLRREDSVTDSAKKPIGSDNIGNKLMKKMGWKEGQGLGKTNQGRTTIVQVEQRLGRAGLGKREYAQRT